jgi:hypothetical protein
MKPYVVRGQTANIGFVFIPDTTSTTGAGKTGLTNASSGLKIAVRREKSSAVTAYSGANIGSITTLGTWADPTSGKVNFKEVDATNMPGLYEIHWEDAILGTSDTSRKLIGLVTVTGGAPTPFEIPLSGADLQDGVRLGLTALPNATAGANGGVPTIDSNLRVKSNLDADQGRRDGRDEPRQDHGRDRPRHRRIERDDHVNSDERAHSCGQRHGSVQGTDHHVRCRYGHRSAARPVHRHHEHQWFRHPVRHGSHDRPGVRGHV